VLVVPPEPPVLPVVDVWPLPQPDKTRATARAARLAAENGEIGAETVAGTREVLCMGRPFDEEATFFLPVATPANLSGNVD